jgi:hypothetical protein
MFVFKQLLTFLKAGCSIIVHLLPLVPTAVDSNHKPWDDEASVLPGTYSNETPF